MTGSHSNSSAARTASGRIDGFANTRWSLVVQARDREPDNAARALEELCQVYWMPLYAYVRRRGYNVEDAQDLTQDFFTRFLAKDALAQVAPEKGKFRSYLLAALKHFLANEWDKARAQKRGGGAVHVSFDTQEAETRYRSAPSDALTPDRLFDRQWALVVLDLALNHLEAEHDTREKQRLFAALRGTLTGEEPAGGYAAVARQLGLTEGAIKVAVHRLRKRYRELLLAEIAQTVADPAQVTDELQALFAAFEG
jgi:RNA polymerase sigma-70 factor (ECF subfamily)